jgi:hypothetical protein
MTDPDEEDLQAEWNSGKLTYEEEDLICEPSDDRDHDEEAPLIWEGLQIVGGCVLFYVLLWLLMAFASIAEPAYPWR